MQGTLCAAPTSHPSLQKAAGAISLEAILSKGSEYHPSLSAPEVSWGVLPLGCLPSAFLMALPLLAVLWAAGLKSGWLTETSVSSEHGIFSGSVGREWSLVREIWPPAVWSICSFQVRKSHSYGWHIYHPEGDAPPHVIPCVHRV